MIKSIRNFLISSSKSFLSMLISLIIAYQPITQTGLVTASHWVYGTKHVYLLGDHHRAGTHETNNEQMDSLMEALKETAYLRNEPLHILWEKSSLSAKSAHKLSCSINGIPRSDRMIQNLDDVLKEKNIHDVVIEDTEIRKEGISAQASFYTFLEEDEGAGDYYAFEGTSLVKDITFQHLIDSFNKWLSVVEEFKSNHESLGVDFDYFDIEVTTARSAYEHFIKTLSKHNVPYSQTTIRHSLKSYEKHDELIKRLSFLIEEMFSNLYDAYLFKKLYEHKGKHVVVLAGAAHTGALKYMLENQNAVDKIHYYQAFREEKDYENIKLISKSQLINVLRGYSYFTLFEASIRTIGLQFATLFSTLTSLIESTQSEIQ